MEIRFAERDEDPVGCCYKAPEEEHHDECVKLRARTWLLIHEYIFDKLR
jgi:hypothetical protein